MNITPTKECLICEKIIVKKLTTSKKEWTNLKYCSPKCRYLGQKQIWNKDKTKHPNWKGGKIELKCKQCDKKFYRDPYQKDRARFCSKACLHKNRTGITFAILKTRKSCLMLRQSLKDLIRHKQPYIDWRTIIFERDGYTCQFCKQKGGKLQVDHIKPFSKIMDENNIETPEEAIMCDELWDTDNGRTLCIDCHRKTPTWGKKYSFAGVISLQDSLLV